MHITIIQALLIGLWFYFASSDALYLGGIAYSTIWRLLVGGFMVGVILGNPMQGMLIGATINLIYLGMSPQAILCRVTRGWPA